MSMVTTDTLKQSRGPTRATALRVTAAAIVIAIGAGSTASRADEAEARRLFKAMSDYMAAQAAISFDYDSTLEVVTTEGQKLGLASSGEVTLNRPDKLRATRTGGFADVEVVFDGTTLSILARNLNAYAQVAAPGTVDQLVDTLRDTYRRPLPAADLLLANVNDALMPLVTDVKDLGSGVIGGIECDHLAFRMAEVDWQIWIAQGDQPYPCRFVVTTSRVAGSPQYTIDVSDWKAGSEVASADFAFAPPADAKKMGPDDMSNLDELPSNFIPGAK